MWTWPQKNKLHITGAWLCVGVMTQSWRDVRRFLGISVSHRFTWGTAPGDNLHSTFKRPDFSRPTDYRMRLCCWSRKSLPIWQPFKNQPAQAGAETYSPNKDEASQNLLYSFIFIFSPFLVPTSSRMLLAPAPAEFPAQGFPLFSIGAFSFPACGGLLICYRGLWTSLDRCLHPAGKNCRGNGTKNKILVLGKKKAPTIAGNTYDFGKAFQLWLNRLRRGILHCQHCLNQFKVWWPKRKELRNS